jgi:hypothetical protein
MGTVNQELERLKFAISKGRGGEKIHVTWVEQDQAERAKINKQVTKFVLETKSPEACAELHTEWGRIMKRVQNKTIALDLCIRAWRDALSNQELDKIMAGMSECGE